MLCSRAIGAGDARGGQVPSIPKARQKRAPINTKPLSLFPVHALWTIELNNDLTTPAPPLFDAARAFVPLDGERLVAYDLAGGKQMWMVPIAAVGQPAASPDLLFVPEAHALTALRVLDGSKAWQLPFPGSLATPLVWDNGWLIAATIDGIVIAFRDSDGHEVWRHDAGSPAHASPALAADRVYVPTEDGRVVALRVDTGAPVWESRLGGAASDILALDDRVYVGSKDNFFYCLNGKDGEQKWRVRTGGDVIGKPAIDEHNVYFVSLDNVLRAVRRNGNQQWKSALKVRPTAGPITAGDAVIVPAQERTLPAFHRTDGTSAGEITGLVTIPVPIPIPVPGETPPPAAAAGAPAAAPLPPPPPPEPIVIGGEVTAAPHVIKVPGVYGPVVILVAKDVAKGAALVAHTRDIEPPLLTVVSPLPNIVTFTPTETTPTIPKL